MESKASRPTIDVVAGDDALRDHDPQPIERAHLKTLHKLDQYCIEDLYETRSVPTWGGVGAVFAAARAHSG